MLAYRRRHPGTCRLWFSGALVLMCLETWAPSFSAALAPGEFEGSTDVGKVELPGSVDFDQATRLPDQRQRCEHLG